VNGESINEMNSPEHICVCMPCKCEDCHVYGKKKEKESLKYIGALKKRKEETKRY
jgi:hypothetical protein